MHDVVKVRERCAHTVRAATSESPAHQLLPPGWSVRFIPVLRSTAAVVWRSCFCVPGSNSRRYTRTIVGSSLEEELRRPLTSSKGVRRHAHRGAAAPDEYTTENAEFVLSRGNPKPNLVLEARPPHCFDRPVLRGFSVPRSRLFLNITSSITTKNLSRLSVTLQLRRRRIRCHSCLDARTLVHT